MSSRAIPKKVGRPTLPKGHAKSGAIQVRLNDADRKRVELAAKVSKRTVSDLARVLIAPPAGVGDIVTVEGREGAFLIVAGWPGKPRYFVSRLGELPQPINLDDSVDSSRVTVFKKGDTHLRQLYP